MQVAATHNCSIALSKQPAGLSRLDITSPAHHASPLLTYTGVLCPVSVTALPQLFTSFEICDMNTQKSSYGTRCNVTVSR
jgi:hypothetical protein